MGWGSGSEIIERSWNACRTHIQEKDRAKVLSELIDIFTDADWDNLDEIMYDWPESKDALILYDSRWKEIFDEREDE